MYVAIFEGILFSLFSLVLVHGLLNYNVKRLLLAFTIIAVVVTVEENLAMIFTQGYSYAGYQLWIGEFPVAIMLAWIVISYIGFLITNRVRNPLVGAITVSSVDIALEPAAYYFGLWTWHKNFPIGCLNFRYFNASVGNALGWIIVALAGTTILTRLVRKKGFRVGIPQETDALKVIEFELEELSNTHLLDDLAGAFNCAPTLNAIKKAIKSKFGVKAKAMWLCDTPANAQTYGSSEPYPVQIPRDAILGCDLGSDGQLWIASKL